MFIEKMNKRSFEKFALEMGANLECCKKEKDGSVYIKLRSNQSGSEIWLTDFDCITLAYAHVYPYIKKKWQMFMYHKFGECYKEALLKYNDEMKHIQMSYNK